MESFGDALAGWQSEEMPFMVVDDGTAYKKFGFSGDDKPGYNAVVAGQPFHRDGTVSAALLGAMIYMTLTGD